MCSLFGNAFRWRLLLYKNQSNWSAVRIKRLFTEKFLSRLLYAVLFIYLFIYLFICLFILFTIYCMSQWIGGETLIFWVNAKITRFLLLANWVWAGLDQLHLYLYIYVSPEFLLLTLIKFTIQYNTIWLISIIILIIKYLYIFRSRCS